jgi:hypothetical protein
MCPGRGRVSLIHAMVRRRITPEAEGDADAPGNALGGGSPPPPPDLALADEAEWHLVGRAFPSYGIDFGLVMPGLQPTSRMLWTMMEIPHIPLEALRHRMARQDRLTPSWMQRAGCPEGRLPGGPSSQACAICENRLG